ncbi:MAG: DciA family protein [Gammaproteobacteria bacterium]
MHSPESIRRIVTRFDRLKQLTDHARQLGALNEKVLALLPPRLAAHARLAKFSDGCLVLQVDSSAWAAEVRYKSPEIVAALARTPEFAGIRSVRVRTSRRSESAPPAPVARATMSTEAADALVAQADSVNDEKLSASLRRLAERAGDPPR